MKYSNTVARHHSALSKEHGLSPHTYFLDKKKRYHLSEKDDGVDTIDALFDSNDNIVTVKSNAVSSEQTASVNTSGVRKERQEFINISSSIIITGILSIFSWIYCLLLKLMVILALIILLVYFDYKKNSLSWAFLTIGNRVLSDS